MKRHRSTKPIIPNSESEIEVEKVVSIGISNYEKYLIFKHVFPEKTNISRDNEMFSKSSAQLLAERCKYSIYTMALKAKEEENQLKSFISNFPGIVKSTKAKKMCKNLGKYLNILMSPDGANLLNPNEKEFIYRVISDIFGSGKCQTFEILQFFNLENLIPPNVFGPSPDPSKIKGDDQLDAQSDGLNHIYGYPFGIKTHFPVILCHPVFGEFMNIIHNWNSDKFMITKEVKNFFINEYEKKPELIESIDKCVFGLIQAFLLADKTTKNESKFVTTVVEALEHVFSEKENVKTQHSTLTGVNGRMKIDAGILIGTFPFILFEAKHMSYSINAVLQGLQYYKLLEKDFIDNDPCFLITFDHGIMFIYGIATVNFRSVCDCLVSLEFTNHHFNINGFLDILHHIISAFYFFHQKFTNRMSVKDFKKNDPMHLKYSKIKHQETPENNKNPWPAIFDIESFNDKSKRISFNFEKIELKNEAGFTFSKSNFKANVYLVKLDNESDVSSEDEDEKMIVKHITFEEDVKKDKDKDKKLAVLKIGYNYDVESHDTLAKLNMAPKIYGYEKLWENCHVILMEYIGFDYKKKQYKCLFNYLQELKKMNLSLEPVFNSLTLFLARIHENEIVHGDFRSNNIMIKTIINNEEKEEFQFKLIDFEFTGKVGSLYPCLAVKNFDIKWPDGFNSYRPRAKAHDKFMLEHMKK